MYGDTDCIWFAVAGERAVGGVTAGAMIPAGTLAERLGKLLDPADIGQTPAIPKDSTLPTSWREQLWTYPEDTRLVCTGSCRSVGSTKVVGISTDRRQERQGAPATSTT